MLAASIAGVALHLAVLQVDGNFHEILPGELYRSAQPTPSELARYIHHYGIKTVINLRGPSDRQWYRDEVATTSELAVQHVDFRMSATRQLSLDESEKLIAILKDAAKPVLIHCRAGADRTGLASVIYLQQVAGVNEETAEWQLSPLYGHVNLPFLRAYAMDRTWFGLERTLGIEEG
jgi:protein tyrosine/serine phosphatase